MQTSPEEEEQKFASRADILRRLQAIRDRYMDLEAEVYVMLQQPPLPPLPVKH